MRGGGVCRTERLGNDWRNGQLLRIVMQGNGNVPLTVVCLRLQLKERSAKRLETACKELVITCHI